MLYCLSNAECSDLEDPANGRIVLSVGNSVRSFTTFLCNSGFELVGAQTLTCQADGMWSDNPPTCKPIGMKSPLYCRMIIMAVTNSKPPNHVTLNYRVIILCAIMCFSCFLIIGYSTYCTCPRYMYYTYMYSTWPSRALRFLSLYYPVFNTQCSILSPMQCALT